MSCGSCALRLALTGVVALAQRLRDALLVPQELDHRLNMFAEHARVLYCLFCLDDVRLLVARRREHLPCQSLFRELVRLARGANEPANTTVILFSLFRHLECSDGILHGYESIVGKTMRKISILIATIAALATAIEKYTNAWIAVI